MYSIINVSFSDCRKFGMEDSFVFWFFVYDRFDVI